MFEGQAANTGDKDGYCELEYASQDQRLAADIMNWAGEAKVCVLRNVLDEPLTDWAQQLGESAPFDFAVLTDPSELADLHEIAADYDLVLIDTPGSRSNMELVSAFLQISDFVVIASEVDGMALSPADRYINELVVPAGKPYSVLLTKVDVRSSEQEKRARDFFAEAEQPVFADAIHLYRAFAGALEDGVIVSMGTSRRGRFRKAAKEYEPVTRELLSTLTTL